ncbi:MAG TPA: ATP-binding protein [Polyangia bacterium]|nr:ATP-binding protein [Polyangia bacterium]
MATRHTVPTSQGLRGAAHPRKRQTKRERVGRGARPRGLRAADAAAARAGEASIIAHVSHELRTPLHAILSLSQLLLDDVVGPLSVEQRKYLEVIDRNGQNLLRMTGDLLDLSRIQAGVLAVDNRAVDVGAVARAAAQALSALAAGKGLALTVDLSDDRGPAWCDGARLEQVLINLIGNAIKFTLKGSVRVAVCHDALAGVARIDVIDTGVGIAPEAQGRIFDEFFQVDPGSSRQGCGLGLALARRMVQLMNGTLAVESAPGVGTRFSLTLPLAEGPTEEGLRGAHSAG